MIVKYRLIIERCFQEVFYVFDKTIFASRLMALRKSRQVTAAALALQIGVSKAAISQFGTGANGPHVKTLTALADYFAVSADYLLGRSDCTGILILDSDGCPAIPKAPPEDG